MSEHQAPVQYDRAKTSPLEWLAFALLLVGLALRITVFRDDPAAKTAIDTSIFTAGAGFIGWQAVQTWRAGQSRFRVACLVVVAASLAYHAVRSLVS